MKAEVTPSRLIGTLQAEPSKSMSHRVIICAALSDGISKIDHLSFSKDVLATIDGLRALGASITCKEHSAVIKGLSAGMVSKSVVLDCGESGSTLRFLIPIAAALGIQAEFRGSGRLPQRPIIPYLNTFPQHGTEFTYQNTMPFSISGQLKPGAFTLPGNVSSQFISGLLFALPMLDHDSTIHIEGQLESKPYVLMTIQMLRDFGIEIGICVDGFYIKGNQHYHSHNAVVEGDFSQAAFFLTAGAISGNVTITGLDYDGTSQGDKAIVDILRQAGADVKIGENSVSVSCSKLSPFAVDAADIPDLVPILSVLACFCSETSRIFHAERLKIKESDRLAAVFDLIQNCGGSAELTDDGLLIYPTEFTSKKCYVESKNDHRIVMSAAILALKAAGGVVILEAEAIHKSYPEFFTHYNMLGGHAHVIDVE